MGATVLDVPTFEEVEADRSSIGQAMGVVLIRRFEADADSRTRWDSPSVLVDEQGYEIPRADVQLARLLDGSREIE